MPDIRALQLESRFSMPPNSLGYCGRDSAPAKFRRCIIKGSCEGVEDEVSKFIVLYPYLKTIAEFAKISPFSYEVIDGYWIGSGLLNKAKPKDYDLLLKNLKSQGVPDFFIKELRGKRPKKFIPSHLFHVLFVGVGRASGAVPFDLNSINNCMIRWGKVENIKKDRLTVRLNSLKSVNGNSYKITVNRQTLAFDKEIIPEVKTGSSVAVHWGQVIKTLNPDETKRLKFWTNEVLKSL